MLEAYDDLLTAIGTEGSGGFPNRPLWSTSRNRLVWPEKTPWAAIPRVFLQIIPDGP